jgi:hypothetical protein
MKHLLLSSLALSLLSTVALAEDKQITVAAGGKPALQLTVPKDAKITPKGDKTFIQANSVSVYLWHIPKAKSVADVAGSVADVIKSEFVNLVVGETKNLKVLGHEAKEIMGKGAEADDNDPGSADVVIFTDGKNIFAACVHGEGDHAAKEHPELMKVLESAKAL